MDSIPQNHHGVYSFAVITLNISNLNVLLRIILFNSALETERLFLCQLTERRDNLSQKIRYDYHYGNEADQYTFFRLPKTLFSNERYKDLSDGAKILYGLMLDRMALSVKNRWLDDQNRVYIYFTLEDIAEQMNCKKDKGVKMLAELDTVKGVGLIERVKQGQGRPTIIYVMKFTDTTEVLTAEKPKS